jgi:hypothetical protein
MADPFAHYPGGLVETTFKPLGRNRFKCIQTKEIVGRGRTNAVRNRRHVELYPPQRPMAEIIISPRQNFVLCPLCDEYNHINPNGEKFTCQGCYESIRIRVRSH